MIQKTFLRQKRAWGNPPVGRIMQRYLQGWWTWVLLPNQPPTDAVSWVSSHGLDGWDPKETAVVFWQGTGIWGKGHLCTHRPRNTWALFGFLSRRCEDEKKHSGRLGIFDLCWLILHQSCQGRTAQVCLDSFSASFCTKGKKIPLHTYSGTRLSREAVVTGNTETSALCWDHSELWNRDGTKIPKRMCCATVQVQKGVDELRNKLGVVSRSPHWGNTLLVWPRTSATSHEPSAVSRLLPRTLWIMTRAGNSVLFIPCLFKLRK